MLFRSDLDMKTLHVLLIWRSGSNVKWDVNVGMRNSIDTTTKADALSIHTIVMSSPFSMLGMLSKARRASNKRNSLTVDNNSDSRSIASVSKEDKKAKKQSSKILRALGKSKGGSDSFPSTSLN